MSGKEFVIAGARPVALLLFVRARGHAQWFALVRLQQFRCCERNAVGAFGAPAMLQGWGSMENPGVGSELATTKLVEKHQARPPHEAECEHAQQVSAMRSGRMSGTLEAARMILGRR